MTRHFDPKELQFYITLPAPCPYLPGKTERKIFTPLDTFHGHQLNNYLTHSGFRRSQNVIYRPACEYCQACKSLRVKALAFSPGKSFKRVLRKNADITRTICESIATNEQFQLLSNYLNARHKGGGMSDMDFERYELMVEDCTANTEIFEYRNPNGTLVAACITDQLNDGFSMVYSFFNPNMAERSLGTYLILDHIAHCKNTGFPNLYLGYWIKNSNKMRYKERFEPFEILYKNGWVKP